jgi:predicted RNase H-like HicB family nuclease
MSTIAIHVERLPEGVYLATSPDLPGLTVEAESYEEARRIAPDIALDLIEAERGAPIAERPDFTFTRD